MFNFLSTPQIRPKESRLSFRDVWQRRFLDKAYMDNSFKGVSREYDFYSDGAATYSKKDKVVYYYTFDSMPKELPVAYVDEFRALARAEVKISFISYLEPNKIDWNSPAVQSKLKVWQKVSEDVQDVNEYNFRENVNLLDNDTWRRQSLLYLSSADIRRGRRTFKFRTMMIIGGVRGEDFDKTVAECESMAGRLGISAHRITEDMGTYLRAYSPMSGEFSSKVSKLVGHTVLTDEVIARFNTYDQGKIGDKGIYWGTDIYSGFPVLKEVKKTTETAENYLFTAETGGGKSFYVKSLLIQLIADARFTGTIMDIEGFEYLPLADFVGISDKVVVLNMAEGQGQYYDPVAITLTGVDYLDEDMLNLASSFTRSIFKVLVGDFRDDSTRATWLSSIISEAVAVTYSQAGVTEDKSTWPLSRNLTLHDVYKNFIRLYEDAVDYRYRVEKGEVVPTAKDNFKLNKAYIDALDSAASSLRTYFEPFERGGVNSHVFSQKIPLSDIVDAKLVVCSFGLAGKSEANIDQVQLALSQSYAAILSQIRSIFAKARGSFNFKLWEEFQRWGRMDGSEAILNSALTGGRKLGDVNIVVTNKVSEMLNEGDKFGIFQNTTSFAIGAISDARVREGLAHSLSIENLEFELDKLVVPQKKGSSGVNTITSIYDKAFLVKLDKSILSIVRMELPDELASSDIFRTGVDLVGG